MHKATKHVRADQSATAQASRAGETQHVVEHLSAARYVLKTNEGIEACPGKQKRHCKQLAMHARRIFLYLFQISTPHNTLLSVSYIFV